MASITEIVMDTAGGLRNAIFTRGTKQTPPEAVMEHVDYTAASIGRKIRRGALAVMASGFGKGLLIAAVVITAGLAISMGVQANAGMLSTAATFGQGMAEGIGHALGFMLSAPGLLTLAVGGTLGAVAESHKSYHAMSAETAAAQAQNYEIARQLSSVRGFDMNLLPEKQTAAPLTIEPESNSAAATIPDCGKCAQELERRARNAQQTYGASR